MSAMAPPIPDPPSLDQLHRCFLGMLPRIERHAHIAFRDVRCPDQKANCIAETIALSWQWHVRLAARGKDVTTFPSVLASLASRAVKCGRRVCGQERARDVLSPVAQRRHGFRVEALPVCIDRSHESFYGTVQELDAYEERLRDNTRTPIPDQASFRLAFPFFLQRLRPRDRRLANYLALGHSAKNAAAHFGISPCRVTQLRQQWCREWYALHGEKAPFEERRKEHRTQDGCVI